MYDIKRYLEDIDRLVASGADVRVIGYTTLKRRIYMLHKGDYEGSQMLVHAGIHAREYITTPLTLSLLETYKGSKGIYLLPSVNIDGMLLCQEGLASIGDEKRRKFLLDVNSGSEDFSLWKANANAVDLNVNFDAGFGKGKGNKRVPSPHGYIGEYPLSEVENQILAGVTSRIKPKITLSYHTKGNVIYQGYEGSVPYPDIAERIAKFINYDLLLSNGSHGGYKDWFVATTSRLGLTIECGNDYLRHPLPLSELDDMKWRQEGLFDYVASLIDGIK